MMTARLVFPCLRWSGRDVDQLWPEVRAAVDLGVGGFVVFGGSLEGMLEIVRLAIERAQRPLLFSADLERGAGQQLAGATSLPPPAALARTGPEGRALAARITAEEAAAAGVGWVLAPVAAARWPLRTADPLPARGPPRTAAAAARAPPRDG